MWCVWCGVVHFALRRHPFMGCLISGYSRRLAPRLLSRGTVARSCLADDVDGSRLSQWGLPFALCGTVFGHYSLSVSVHPSGGGGGSRARCVNSANDFQTATCGASSDRGMIPQCCVVRNPLFEVRQNRYIRGFALPSARPGAFLRLICMRPQHPNRHRTTGVTQMAFAGPQRHRQAILPPLGYLGSLNGGQTL